jgi:hypothetical protein
MKASLNLGSAIDKGIQFLAFIPVLVWVFYPHLVAQADFSLQNKGTTAQIFEIKGQIPNSEKEDQTVTAVASNIEVVQKAQIPSLAYAELAAHDMEFQTKTGYKDALRNYLTSRGSPFAACVDTIVELKNADKILSLANAESGLGRRTVPGTYNYWGVMAGSKLKKMGNNTCEGIVNMNSFLNDYPRRSSVKYAEMPLVQMCGLYKQPCPGKANNHWVGNNQALLVQLNQMWTKSAQIAYERVNNGGGTVHTALAGNAELAEK